MFRLPFKVYREECFQIVFFRKLFLKRYVKFKVIYLAYRKVLNRAISMPPFNVAQFLHRGEVALRIHKLKYDRQRYWKKLKE